MCRYRMPRTPSAISRPLVSTWRLTRIALCACARARACVHARVCASMFVRVRPCVCALPSSRCYGAHSGYDIGANVIDALDVLDEALPRECPTAKIKHAANLVPGGDAL